MAEIVTIHSFRRGTGKSTVSVNLATLLMQQGYRVGLLDANFEAPSLFVFFGLSEEKLTHSLNSFLWGDCQIDDAVLDLTDKVEQNSGNGRLHFISASPKKNDIARILRGGFYLNLLGDGFQEILENFDLDYLIIDTNAGINEETLFIVAIANTLIVTLHTDKQDYQGTAILLDVAHRLSVPRTFLLANEVPLKYDPKQVVAQLMENYQCDNAHVMPYSEDVIALASTDVFVNHHSNHPITQALQQLMMNLTNSQFTV